MPNFIAARRDGGVARQLKAETLGGAWTERDTLFSGEGEGDSDVVVFAQTTRPCSVRDEIYEPLPDDGESVEVQIMMAGERGRLRVHHDVDFTDEPGGHNHK